MAGCAQRNAIPAKIEIQNKAGNLLPPEKCDPSTLGDLPDAERSALFALSQWCGGKLTSFLQLDLEQTSELLKILHQQECFFAANSPEITIPWDSGGLKGVTEYLGHEKNKPPASPKPRIREIEGGEEGLPDASIPDKPDYKGPPIEVEGSTEYLRIILPGSQHPGYAQVLSLMRKWNFMRDRSHRHWWWLRDPSKVLDFIASHQEDLELDHDAVFTDNYRKRVASIEKAVFRTEATETGENAAVRTWIEAGDTPTETIEQALATGRNHFKHGEKTFLITPELKEKAARVQRRASGQADAPLLARSSHPVTRFQSLSLESFLSEEDPRFRPPEQWKKRAIALGNLSSLPTPKMMDGLEKTLRPYQIMGVGWMTHLFDNGLGGILADEMGLGKTLQSLAFLSVLRKRGGPAGTSLVICPATLVENWKREALRFLPSFSVYAHHGSNRSNSPSFLGKFDLVITSYGTLVRDLELFRDFPLLCVIGDEAQHLKNRRTQNAKAAAALISEGRMLLTGTPIENSASDLLALLEFLLPGAHPSLPSAARGEERIWYERLIIQEGAPYILRRTKVEVAPELPQKIEQVLYLDLNEDQRELYEQTRRSAEWELDQLASSGSDAGVMRMKTLTQLLRLRQICCDPRLIDAEFDPIRSCKLRAFRELLYNCLENGHRMLVFSQFRKVLKLLESELQASSLSYCYLDGTSTDRMAQVDRFQENDSIPVFLISLKAGGTGLNLTGADVVLHFDPWWNPAAESQATDRAHRIGQNRTVNVYKMITCGTVEEKVLQLQDGKRKLLEQVFEEAEASNLSLSVGDLRELI